MMTTLAMIAGMLPIALALGEGGEFRAPMARAVIGGLITSTMLTLIVVPVAYAYFDDFGIWIKSRFVDETRELEITSEHARRGCTTPWRGNARNASDGSTTIEPKTIGLLR